MPLLTHCIGHITTSSFMGRGNQYIQLVKVLPTNGWQLNQLSYSKLGRESNSDLRVGGESVTTLPPWPPDNTFRLLSQN